MGLNLELLKREYEEAIKQTGGGDGYWSPRESSNLIRIVPRKEDTGLFYKKVGVHFKLLGASMEFCPKESLGLDCPVCSFIEHLTTIGTPQAANLMNQIKVVRRYLMNIICLDADKEKVMQYLSGVGIRKDLLGIMLDPDYGDVTDVKTGRNIVIEKFVPGGDKSKTKYTVRAKPNVSELSIEVYNNALNLDEFIKSRVKSYEELAKVLMGSGDGIEGEIDAGDVLSKYANKKEKQNVPYVENAEKAEKENGSMSTTNVASVSKVDDEVRNKIKSLFKK